MTNTFVAEDQAHRSRIEASLDETLFVEAGAGTGKTEALVSRVVNLIGSGRATVDQIAAITFTEAAAAELRDRVRQRLDAGSRDAGVSETQRQRCLDAARRVERGAFQTIHSFAASLLRGRPLEAGLPPGFDTLDEIQADIDFERRWRDWLELALDAEEAAPGLARCLRMGIHVTVSRLREIVLAFHGNYDLLTRGFARHPEPGAGEVDVIVSERQRIERLLTLAKNGVLDPLAVHARGVAAMARRLESLAGDVEACVRRLTRFGSLSFGRGRQADWLTDPDTDVNGCKALKELLKDLEEARGSFLEAAYRSALYPLLEDLRRFVLDYAQTRKQEGRAEFHDLLVWARDLLKQNGGARLHFRDRYRYILVDEFQDTDPVQTEIALLLAGEEDTSGNGPGAAPGRLFVVGDPKQSIYRFRRADIGTVVKIRERFSEGVVPLTQNFRCQEPIIDWVNAVFDLWMSDAQQTVQAPYRSLQARWSPPKAHPPLGVHFIAGTRETADSVRREEARAIAQLLRTIKSERWQVRDEADGDTIYRPAEYRDVCILIPTRTALRHLETELSEGGVPYRIESQSMVLSSQDVRELIGCLRAIDSPADKVALVAALRSSAFACSDVDLLRFVESGGSLSYVDHSGGSGPVSNALAVLSSFHRDRMWEAPDLLIERFVRDRRMIELSFARARPRERWRRLRFVVERARAFSEATGGGLRDFLDWIERQAETGARMIEIPVPETDEDAVRVMTIHAAKGLEFPVVIMAGLGGEGRGGSEPVIFDRASGAAEARLTPTGGLAPNTVGYSEASEASKEADGAEQVRLMYVAATRAKDHLVVSLYRSERGRNSVAHRIIELAEQTPHLWRGITGLHPGATAGNTAPPGDASHEIEGLPPSLTPSGTAADRERWLEGRREVIARASVPATVTASGLARDSKDEPDFAERPGRRGRAGTGIGRAVHAVLQTVDLQSGAGIPDLSRRQAEIEGVSQYTAEVTKLAGRAIESDVVRRAVASGRLHREVFVAAPVEGRILEGYIDLCFEEDDGLVIVDYKTDAAPEEEDAGPTPYRAQVGAYALALSRGTGMPVKEAVLLFLQRDPMAERFTDIESLMAEAEGMVRVGLG